MIKENIERFARRDKVPIYNEIVLEDNFYRKAKKTHKYLICDYCGKKISLDVQKHERKGGIATLSYVITKNKTVNVALCNECVKPALEEF